MKDLTPNLMVKNVRKSVDFYQNVLGFEALEVVPQGDTLVFAILRSGNAMIMLQEENSLKEELPQLSKYSPGAGMTLYIHVEDVHALYEKVKGKATIAKEMHDTFYGSTDFAIEDCNGYMLVFSEDKNNYQ